MAARGRRAGGRCGVSAGPAAAPPGSRCRGWHWGRQGSRSGAARAQPPAQLSCQAGTRPRELRRAAPAGRGGQTWAVALGAPSPVPMAAVPWPRRTAVPARRSRCPGSGSSPAGAAGARSRVPGAGRQPGAGVVPWGWLPGAVGRGGLFILFSLQTISFCLCSLFSSSFKERDRFPRPPPLQHQDPRHASGTCQRQGHQPGGTPGPVAFPAGQAQGLRSPQPRSRATLLPRGGGRQGHRCSPPPSGRGMGARPGYLGPFPSSQRARGPCGARGRGPAGWLAPCSPSWVTHPPQCGCEVPRQRL